jgi:hypothetical protein
MSSLHNPITPQQLRHIADNDLEFILRLRDLGESSTSDARIWGTFIQEKYDPQVVRRLYVRTFISLVESIIATLKDETLRSTVRLSTAEKAILAGTKYELTDQGAAVERPFFAPVQKSLRFAFRSFAKANRITFTPDYNGEGWRAFSETVKIRNRITHPKRVEEMAIEDTELALVDQAHDWFIKSYGGLMDAYIVKLENKLSSVGNGKGDVRQ